MLVQERIPSLLWHHWIMSTDRCTCGVGNEAVGPLSMSIGGFELTYICNGIKCIFNIFLDCAC